MSRIKLKASIAEIKSRERRRPRRLKRLKRLRRRRSELPRGKKNCSKKERNWESKSKSMGTVLVTIAKMGVLYSNFSIQGRERNRRRLKY